MSIKISNLTKTFGSQNAVDNISFEIHENEIVGFLGPNGAGKSTTMKIATCFQPPTDGSVEVCGMDVALRPNDVKKKIGYLPEHNPLYLDMYVHEYLGFIGRLHGMRGKALEARVIEIVGLCGLDVEQNKIIGALSKGYRQRVGLAQALIHDPEVLILDEPTTGLDPNQISEVRNLIKEVSKGKTVIFSTHIMQEVEAICDRVIIINKGEIVADDLLQNLDLGASENSVVAVEFEADCDMQSLEGIKGVLSIEITSESTCKLVCEKDADIRSEVFKLAGQNNLPLVGLKVEERSLEDIFKSLTKEPA